MKLNRLLYILLVLVTLLPAAADAASKKNSPDRELAGELSASLVVVANEIQRFADIRDQLARTRRRTMQGLETDLVQVQQGNAFDVRVWEVVRETYRVNVFHSVLDATNDIATQRQAAVEREAEQAQQLANTRSAVSRNTSGLQSAASSLAALAEPPIKGQAAAELVKSTLSELATSLGKEHPKLKQGLDIASKLAGEVESRLEAGSTVPAGQ